MRKKNWFESEAKPIIGDFYEKFILSMNNMYTMSLLSYLPMTLALIVSAIISYFVYKKLNFNKYVKIVIFLAMTYVLWIILSFVFVSLGYSIGVFSP